MAKSPSITLIERDASSYAVTTSDSILAIVGYATKGTIGSVIQCTSRNDFVEKFGPPSSSSPYASLAAYRAFNQSNQVLFYRVANETDGDTYEALQASRNVNGDTTEGDTSTISFIMDEKGSALNGSATAGAYIIKETRYNPVGGDSIYDLKFYYNAGIKETYLDVSFDSGDTNYFVTTINSASDNGGSAWFSVTVSQQGTGTTAFVEDGTYYIGADSGDTGDTYWETGDTITALYGTDTWFDYKPGTDGIAASGGDTLFSTALATNGALANMELWDFHILIAPDSSAEVTANAGVALCDFRKDAIFIADPPYGKTYAGATAWHNGDSGRSTALNSSYAAAYWPWLKDYDSVNGEYVWCPPSVFVAEKYLQVDRTYGPWYAAAGDVRGKIAAFDYEASPSLAERDVMYGDLNALNPIVNFATKGLEIFGQKTLLRETSALNRVNVRRMVIYAKKLIKVAMDSMVFEPHNADSWAKATNLINAILEPIRQRNGLADYKVTIDDTTNTASLIQQSIMSGVIQLVPVGTIEIIELSIQIQAAGTTIE